MSTEDFNSPTHPQLITSPATSATWGLEVLLVQLALMALDSLD